MIQDFLVHHSDRGVQRSTEHIGSQVVANLLAANQALGVIA